MGDVSATSEWATVLVEARRVAADIGGLFDIELDAATMLAGRAAIMDLAAQGRISAGGATRLLATVDGWCAVALPRDDDVAALPALMEVDEVAGDHWAALTRWAATCSTENVVDRTQLLDIAAAALGESAAAPPVVRPSGSSAGSRGFKGLLVADFSSLWAGPLCAQLLNRAGATVVKVESRNRPDGTRSGEPAFFDWMNSGKLCYAVDFNHGGDGLRRKLSIDDVPARPGRIWLRIKGYRDEPHRPAFGDDAAVAGGLVGAAADGPVFCGDAIADPLSGLEAARAVGESLRRGGGEVIEVSMAQVAARYAALPQSWNSAAPADRPQAPPAVPSASALGADNAAVEHLVSERISATC
jgi:CoA-transferase family III